ncbi:hypothetical protein AUC60_17735 [Pseudomonas caspiana]|uniref:Uncharacterized protein n=2 Tax=Pseudomonas caspiana TaxID=1451454 RepID=A0A1Y3NY80_9PSED|nr:hypothetical protein AUC60_17735 [Pseudomonas caspiana]
MVPGVMDLCQQEKSCSESLPARIASVSAQRSFYFSESSADRIVRNLDDLRDLVFPKRPHIDGDNEQRCSQSFPSVCLIGLGHCGSNIALDVAELVFNARKFYSNEELTSERWFPIGKSRFEKKSNFAQWIRHNVRLLPNKMSKPLFLVEPLVILGDLDKDIAGRIHLSRRGQKSGFLRYYSKMKIMDLSEVHAGGAGNAPILGQYLAKIILNRETQQFSSLDWKMIHSYLIDSCGIKANQSRLYFSIFSAGGGTGSGMASEFGLAQQHSYMNKTFDTKPTDEDNGNSSHSFVFEPIFSSGICVLPNVSQHSGEMSEALHINAGRLLCKYLSEEWDFSYNVANEVSSTSNVMERIRPWNAMMLISNDIMRYAEEGGNSLCSDVNAMEKHANQYIAQQIFNILTAQAVTTDYDNSYFRRAGMDIGETIRLDANDLFMSLAGPVAIAYAESVVSETQPQGIEKFKNTDKEQQHLDIDDLFFRSIDLPHFNTDTRAIEGISILPVEAKRYRASLEEYKSSGYDGASLRDLHFYKNCSSVVSIVSLPKDYKLSFTDLNRLKTHLNNLFPNTTLKRYALVIGASANLSLTTLVAKSPCLSDDFLTLIVAFVKRCFAKTPYRFDDTIDNAILDCISDENLDEGLIDYLLNDFENPAKILDTNWYAIKPMYEKKYRELIHDKDKYISINDIRLSRESVKKAIKYLREIYRHRIGETKLVSLSTPAHPV